MKFRTITLITFLVSWVPFFEASTETYAADNHDGFEQRTKYFFERNSTNPYPAINEKTGYQATAWHHLNFAVSSLFTGVNEQKANESLIEVARLGTKGKIKEGEERFHWIAPLLGRAYLLFDENNNYGRLSNTAATAIERVIFSYIEEKSRCEYYDQDELWAVWGSENHDEQFFCSLWTGLLILKDKPLYQDRVLSDGKSLSEHFELLDIFIKKKFVERLKYGLSIESFSPGYAKYSYQCWVNYYDFGDEQMRQAVKSCMDAWWTEWAIEQLDGVKGGAKVRAYQGPQTRSGTAGEIGSMAWYYFGIGNANYVHPALLNMVTSSYRVPDEIIEIALRPNERGSYELKARKLGLYEDYQAITHSQPHPEDSFERFNTEKGGLLKYSYCTPDYIMSSWLMEKHFAFKWVPMSSQNRWQGIIFSGDKNSRIFPQCEGIGNGKTYNQYWSVQNRNTAVVCKLSGPDFSMQASDMRVWFSSDLVKEQKDNWYFAQSANAYAAVGTSPYAGASWDDSNWLRMKESMYPVIFEVVSQNDYDSFEAFKEDILDNKMSFSNFILEYEGLGGNFTFYYSGVELPEINGQAIDVYPKSSYQSPYLRGTWGEADVKINGLGHHGNQLP